MTTYTFSTQIDPALFDEEQDTTYVDSTSAGRTLWVRPRAGKTLKVRNYADGTALADTLMLDGGYVSFTTTDIPAVQVSPDNGATWVGPIIATAALLAVLDQAVNATAALTAANQAVATANKAATDAATALAEVQSGGGGGFTGHVDWLTQIDNRPVIPSTASQIGAIAASDKGAALGVATLDTNVQVPVAELPTGTSATTVALGNHIHAVPFDWAWPGAVAQILYSTANGWAKRPTARADLFVIWRGPSQAPAGNGYMLNGVDEYKYDPNPAP